MRVYGRGDDDGVDRRVGEHALDPRGHAGAGVTSAILAQALRVEVTDPPDAGVEVVAEHPQQVRPPVPEADDGYPNRSVAGAGSCLVELRSVDFSIWPLLRLLSW